jgi:hypothetical protein
MSKKKLRLNKSIKSTRHKVELVHDVMKGDEQFVPLHTSVLITEEHNVEVNTDQLICTTEYLTIQGEMSYKPITL